MVIGGLRGLVGLWAVLDGGDGGGGEGAGGREEGGTGIRFMPGVVGLVILGWLISGGAGAFVAVEGGLAVNAVAGVAVGVPDAGVHCCICVVWQFSFGTYGACAQFLHLDGMGRVA